MILGTIYSELIGIGVVLKVLKSSSKLGLFHQEGLFTPNCMRWLPHKLYLVCIHSCKQ